MRRLPFVVLPEIAAQLNDTLYQARLYYQLPAEDAKELHDLSTAFAEATQRLNVLLEKHQ